VSAAAAAATAPSTRPARAEHETETIDAYEIRSWALAAAGCAVAAGARTSEPDEHQGRKDDNLVVDAPPGQAFNVGANGSLKLSNVAGDVRVTGGGGTEIKVEARIHGKGKTDAEAARSSTASRWTCGRTAAASTSRPRTSATARLGRLHVVVPTGTSVDVHSVSGDVSSARSAAARGRDVSGDVTATGWPRSRRCAASRATCIATGLSSDGAVTFNSVSGDVTVKTLKAKSATFETVSGDARVDGCDCGGAQSSSVSGDVSYTGTLAKGGRYVFNSHSGDIVMVTPSGFELDAATFSGDIRVDGLTGQGETDRPPHRRGTVGGGGAVVGKTFAIRASTACAKDSRLWAPHDAPTADSGTGIAIMPAGGPSINPHFSQAHRILRRRHRTGCAHGAGHAAAPAAELGSRCHGPGRRARARLRPRPQGPEGRRQSSLPAPGVRLTPRGDERPLAPPPAYSAMSSSQAPRSRAAGRDIVPSADIGKVAKGKARRRARRGRKLRGDDPSKFDQSRQPLFDSPGRRLS
jgi:hypothetical protein